jgi:hypothetical protein
MVGQKKKVYTEAELVEKRRSAAARTRAWNAANPEKKKELNARRRGGNRPSESELDKQNHRQRIAAKRADAQKQRLTEDPEYAAKVARCAELALPRLSKYDPDYEEKRKEQGRIRAKDTRARNPGKARETSRLRALTGRGVKITLEQMRELLELAASQCELCGRTVETVCVDHDHDTGRVRGVLCISCNRTLWMAEKASKDLEYGLRLAAYLRRGNL